MTDLLPVMPRYEAYQDSGVAWIGEIPEHWHIERIKFLFKEINIRSKSGLEDLLSVSQYTGVTKRKHKFNDDEDIITTASSLEGYKKVFKGDLVSNIMLAWNGCLGFSKYNGITSPAYSIYRLKVHAIEKYFHYLFPTGIYKAEFKRKSSGVIESRLRLYTENFFNIWSLFPPLHEQTVIANFLDCKTTKIDQAVTIKEKQIQLLKERKQILIQNAVTKGLDPNVPMADSGVEWIGQIPAHWGIVTLKRVVLFIRTGPFGAELHTHDYVENGTPLINPKHMNEGNILPSPSCSVDEATKERLNKYALVENDLILARRGEMGRAAVITNKEAGWLCGTGSIIIRLKQHTFNSHFLFRLISDIGFIETLKLDSVGSTMDNINSSIVGNLVFPIPPYQEQNHIVSYIQTQSAKIDQAITIQTQMIEKLKEYKAALINSAVTGKIKVTGGHNKP